MTVGAALSRRSLRSPALSTTPESRPPLPPFTAETARQKVRLAEDAWNSRDAQRVSLACTVDAVWRNRAEFPVGRAQAQAFLERKWACEHDCRLIKTECGHSRLPRQRPPSILMESSP